MGFFSIRRSGAKVHAHLNKSTLKSNISDENAVF